MNDSIRNYELNSIRDFNFIVTVFKLNNNYPFGNLKSILANFLSKL